MPTILITGSQGNIGSYLVKHLQKNYPRYKIIRVKNLKKDKNIIEKGVYVGDLTDASFVKNIFNENKIDYVILAAAKSYNAAGFGKDAYDLFKNDVSCLLNVLNHSQKVKKLIYLSSAMIYESSAKTPFTENLTDEIMPPKSSYGLAKYLGEKAIEFFHKQYGINYTIWRLFNVVSPLEDHTRGSGHVFIDFYRKLFIEKTPKIEIFGDGRQTRCFTWVEDVAEAIIDFLTDPKTDCQIFNIGSNEPKTLTELKDVLLKIGKEEKILPSNYNPQIITGNKFFGVDVQKRIPDTHKAQEMLKWRSKTNFYQCFKKFIEYKTIESKNKS